MLDDLDLSGVTDPEARRILGVLLNVIETQAAEIATLRAENQRGVRPQGTVSVAGDGPHAGYSRHR